MTTQFHDPPPAPSTVPASGDDMTANQGRAAPGAGDPAAAGPPLSATERTGTAGSARWGRPTGRGCMRSWTQGWSPTSG